ncbi:hypothetical protein CQA53_10145, partial [Helicobacter didelphidarum]
MKMSYSILSIIGILVAVVLFSGCGSFGFIPYELQPSYWKFKEICEANYDILDSNERTKKLLNLFNVND